MEVAGAVREREDLRDEHLDGGAALVTAPTQQAARTQRLALAEESVTAADTTVTTRAARFERKNECVRPLPRRLRARLEEARVHIRPARLELVMPPPHGRVVEPDGEKHLHPGISPKFTLRHESPPAVTLRCDAVDRSRRVDIGRDYGQVLTPAAFSRPFFARGAFASRSAR